MKRILITSTELMMLHFLTPHVNNLLEHGYHVEIACSEVGGRFAEVVDLFQKIPVHHLSLHRNPLSSDNFKGIFELRKIIECGNFDIIWTNEPVMGVMTRIAACKFRKNGLKVMYVAHGFHFYKGSSLKNWILFYPVEKFMSRFTDEIVTINREDYNLASTKMHASKYGYIHGIGVDTNRFSKTKIDVKAKREEISVPENAIMFLSVGELGARKNHEVIIKALSRMNYENIYYVLCGEGKLDQYLKNLASELNIREHVIFLGYRRDIAELCKCMDVFVHPSKREGLGLAALEAMASGVPVVASKINGILDYTRDGVTGYTCNADDVEGFARVLTDLCKDPQKRKIMGQNAYEESRKFDISISKMEIIDILDSLN